ncbi:MAG: Ldh family oxidoreductase [Deltaproteobacteria bacterium]|nr:Ldh family oxidoreductase [Deltaproteobacteria bacterium]
MTVPHEKLHDFCVEALERVGARRTDAELVARSLVFSDLRGVDTHGVVRLPGYIRTIKKGGMNPAATPGLVQDRGTTAVIDGKCAISQAVAHMAMELALRKAREHGVGVVGVRGSGHIGALSFWSMYALERRMIGFAAQNTGPMLAPWGGIQPVLGHNPWSVAVPGGQEGDVVVDMANSTVAKGKIMLAAMKGERIPEGWALNRRGEPTTDAKEAMDGFLTPVGGHKGYGLTLIISVLTSLLTGAALDKDMPGMVEDRPRNTGHLMAALDVERFLPFSEFAGRLDQMLRALRAAPRATGVDRIYVPGEIEQRCAEARMREGIPLPGPVVEEVRKLAGELGLASPC